MTTKDAFIAVRIDCETDALAFETRADLIEFCNRKPEYQPIESGVYTLADALAIWGESV